jgi:hypothetical protein
MYSTRRILTGILPPTFVVAAYFACSSAPPPPPTNTAKNPDPPAASASSATIVSPKTLCQQLAVEQKKALDAWPTDNKSGDIGPFTQLDDIRETFTKCTQHSKGASGAVIGPPPANGAGFSWRIVYVHNDGSRSEQQDGAFQGYCYAIHLGFARTMTINDGDELLATQFNVSCPDGEGYDENHLYRIHGGKLETLPELTKTKFSLEDIDGDKLLDALRTDILKVEYSVCHSMNGTFDYVFPLAMHTLPDGTLSMVDAVAKENAKKRCAQKPPAIIPKDRSPQQALDNLVCARLYGATTDALRVEVDGFCKGIDTTCKCKEKDCCEDEIACRDALCGTTKAAREIIAKPLPFTLN